MDGTQIAYLIGAAVAFSIFLFLVRRASDKHAAQSARKVRERLSDQSESDDKENREDKAAGEEKYAEDDEENEHDDEEHDEESELYERGEDADEEDTGEGDTGEEDAGEPPNKALQRGLSRTRGGFVAKLGRLFSRKKIDENILDELEQVLFTADIGPKTSNKIFQSIKTALSRDQLGDSEAIWTQIREQSEAILSVEAEPLDFARTKPFVLLTIGVNGVGKTTTIGKIAAKLTRQGKKVILGAGDTFRAAAVEQLEIWGDRAGAPVIKGKDQGDPSSVLYDTIKRGVDEGYDVIICDTAGRLHTKVDLMEELKKVRRVCDKALPGAPHETFLVLDATTGQNAIQQAQMFKQAMDITGIVLTKLDGTAKGGVILGICDELGVPVRYVGIGESIDDLREFDADAFVSALYEHAGTTEAA